MTTVDSYLRSASYIAGIKFATYLIRKPGFPKLFTQLITHISSQVRVFSAHFDDGYEARCNYAYYSQVTAAALHRATVESSSLTLRTAGGYHRRTYSCACGP